MRITLNCGRFYFFIILLKKVVPRILIFFRFNIKFKGKGRALTFARYHYKDQRPKYRLYFSKENGLNIYDS